MSIDFQGKDEEVLISNNWDKYRPKFVLIEILYPNKFYNEDYKIN